MSPPRPTRALRIGEHRFDPVLNELAGPAGKQRLPLKLADLLLRLASEPGQLVRRDTLLDEVWERRHVNEEVLSRAIADLRVALGDDARAPRYIETLPKLGYRMIATVAVDAAPEPGAPPAPAPGPEPGPGPALTPSPATPARTRYSAPILLFSILLAAGVGMARWWEAKMTLPVVATLTPARLLEARPFTSESGRELQPRFTPDGRWVVYTRFVPGGAPAHLRLRAIDGTEDRALVQDDFENYCGTVSPDGSRLAWLRTREGRCEVMQRELLGGAAQALADCGTGNSLGCPDFTRDGRALLLEGNDSERGVREITLADGASRTLTTPPAGVTDLVPRASRDGAAIVFWRGDGNARRLMRLARAGGEPVALDASGHLAFGHAFDLDGALVVADDRFGQRALVRLAGAAPELLGGHGARFPDVAPDGALVYEVAQYDANLWRIDLRDPAAPPRQLTQAARYDSQPAVSPDGAWIAFGSNRDGREGVYLMGADGRDERKLALDPRHRWTSPAWSADGAQLLVLRYTEQEASVCRHELASGTTDCPAGLARNRSGTFFLAPRRFAATDETTRDAALWQHGFDGEPAVRIDTQGPVDRCRASARWLACHRPGRAGLWLQDRATGEARDILPQLDAGLRAWDLAGDAVWFPLGGQERGLQRHDLATGETHRVHAWLPTAIGDALSVAPDGSFAVLARTDALDVDLMLLPAPRAN
jgi:Tol biopolymer transport system component/DNA-binding winged helix-turn-helix (wHTH) protein